MHEEQQSLALQRKAVNALAMEYRGFTPALAFRHDAPTIKELCDKEGVEEVEATFTLHLVALSRFLNLKAGLTEEQIDYIVGKLTTDYKWFKMADFAIIIDRIKSAHYGTFYENFNATKFLEVIQQYDIERNEAIERMRIEEKEAASKTLANATANLPYTIKDGRIVLNKAMNEEAERRKAAEMETARKEAVKRKIFNDAMQIQRESGCTIQEAYELATQLNNE